MTSNTAPYGVASASTEYGASFAAWKAFDQSTGYWITTQYNTTGWLKYKFQSGVGVDAKAIINEYRLSCLSGGASYAPKTWTFEASDTGSFAGEEITLDTQTDITGWVYGTPKTFEFSNTTGYYYYRIKITANNGKVDYLGFLELELWGEFESGVKPGISFGSANMMVI